MRKIFLLPLVLTISINAQDYDNGKKLFRNNCASCHNMEKRVVGPALKNTVKNQGEDWTKAWIKNNQALRDAGDKHANEIFQEYNGMAMPVYEHLGEDAINDITTYLAQYNDKKAEAAASKPSSGAGAPVIIQQTGLSLFEKVLLGIIGAVLLIVILVLKFALGTVSEAYRKGKATEVYLMKKQNQDFQEVNDEFNEFLEDEVEKRVEEKMKTFEKQINKLTKSTFSKKKKK